MKRILMVAFLLLGILGGCSMKQESKAALPLPQLNPVIDENSTVVDIKTNLGDISVLLFPEIAPKAVENFIVLSQRDYFDNTLFHRVVKDFVIQAGDPEATGMGGESIWEEGFAPEISSQLYHINGALGMARPEGSVFENNQGSQFYIVTNTIDQTEEIKAHKEMKEQMPYLLTEDDYPDEILEKYKEGGIPYLDTQYTIFGQVVTGMETVQSISEIDVDHHEMPVDSVVIESVTVRK